MRTFYVWNECYTIEDLPFSGLELYASYDWRDTAPNTHHGLFLIHHFVHISSITQKPQSACNSTTHQTTPLLLRMLCFMLKAAKQLQPTSYGPVQTLLSCCLVHKYEWQQNSGRLQLYYNTVTTAFLPRLHLLEIQTEVRWLTSCRPATIAVSFHYM